MNPLVDFTLRSFFASRADLFGDKSTYLRFDIARGIDPSDGFSSDIMFGRIVYDEDGHANVSSPFALKLSPATISYKGIFVMYSFVNEIFFYSKMVPFFSRLRRLEHLFPTFYASHVEINQNLERVVLVYENLQDSGYRTAPSKAFLDYDHLALMMRRLGEFHSYSYAAKTHDPVYFRSLADAFKEVHFTVTKEMQFVLPFCGPRGMQPLRGHHKYASKLSNVEKIIARANEFMAEILTSEKDHPTAVLCHGDYLRNNVLFKYDRSRPVDMKLIDLASCKLASPVIDLALVLYINAGQQMRDEHWDDLLDEYYATLSCTFPACKVPTREQIVAEFKVKSMNAYLIASYFLPELLVHDLNLPSQDELIPEKYRKCLPHELPEEINTAVMGKLGGSIAVEALADILKDMIDRGFV